MKLGVPPPPPLTYRNTDLMVCLAYYCDLKSKEWVCSLTYMSVLKTHLTIYSFWTCSGKYSLIYHTVHKEPAVGIICKGSCGTIFFTVRITNIGSVVSLSMCPWLYYNKTAWVWWSVWQYHWVWGGRGTKWYYHIEHQTKVLFLYPTV